jgi:hypothetical protein
MSLMEQNYFTKNEVDLIIYDNSMYPQLAEEDLHAISKKFNVTYLNTPENLSLREIYEETFSAFDDYKYVLLLDDDSNLPVDYLSVFFENKSKFNSNTVFVPKVSVHNKCISPYTSRFILSKPITESFVGFKNNVTAINSGIFVPLSYEFSLFKYPLYCSFYGTDTFLFEYFHRKRYLIYTIGVTILHDLSFHPKSNKTSYLNSLNKVVKFWYEHYKTDTFKTYMLNVYLMLLSLKLSIRYKEIINLFKGKNHE